MIKTQFIENLLPKDDILSPFLVKYIATAVGKDGKAYLNVILADRSGEIEARKWQGAELALSKIKAGDIVSVSGKINLYQGRAQLIIQDMAKLESSQFNLEEFVQKAGSAPEKMYQELLNIINSLEEIYIRDLLKLILSEHEIARRLKVWQAGKSIHHAYQSGLLEHILSCSQLAISLSAHYKVNRSYVVAGCILHDLCKIYELTEGPVVEYTDEGKLIGHLVGGVELIEEYSRKIQNFPLSVKNHLKHILLSHHGEHEFGSPKIPHTSEAYLVHLIDLMDSKMNSYEQIKSHDTNVGAWSGFVKHLDRIVYKNKLPSFTAYFEEEGQKSKGASTAMGKLLSGFKVESE